MKCSVRIGLYALPMMAWCVAGGPQPARAEDLAAARNCTVIAANTARLACFDAAFGAATASPKPTFGDTGQFPAEIKAKKSLPKNMSAKVQAVVALPQGRYRLTLDNEQVWETREAEWAMQFQTNDAVTITRMVMGGYQISQTGTGRSLGIKRIK